MSEEEEEEIQFEYESDDGLLNGLDGEEEIDEESILLENAFYEAQDVQLSDPHQVRENRQKPKDGQGRRRTKPSNGRPRTAELLLSSSFFLLLLLHNGHPHVPARTAHMHARTPPRVYTDVYANVSTLMGIRVYTYTSLLVCRYIRMCIRVYRYSWVCLFFPLRKALRMRRMQVLRSLSEGADTPLDVHAGRYTHRQLCTHIHVCIYVYVYTFVCMSRAESIACARVRVWTSVCISVCMHACTPLSISVRMCIHACVKICMCLASACGLRTLAEASLSLVLYRRAWRIHPSVQVTMWSRPPLGVFFFFSLELFFCGAGFATLRGSGREGRAERQEEKRRKKRR